MSEAKNLFPLLQQAADPGIVDAIEKLVRDAPDRDLCRVNVLDFAAKRDLDEEKSITAFLHSARLSLFELSWNVLPPGCTGVVNAGSPLRPVLRGPVADSTQPLEVKGQPTRERQSLSLLVEKVRPATETIGLSPAPLRLSRENRTYTRVLPGLGVATDRHGELLSRRKPFLSA